MNKMVMTIAAGVYALSPAPGVSEIAARVATRFESRLAVEPTPMPVAWVGINGGASGGSSDRSSLNTRRVCSRSYTLSLQKMIFTAFEEECSLKKSGVVKEPGTAVTVGSHAS